MSQVSCHRKKKKLPHTPSWWLKKRVIGQFWTGLDLIFYEKKKIKILFSIERWSFVHQRASSPLFLSLCCLDLIFYQGISLVLRIRFKNLILKFFGGKKKKKKTSVEWFRPVLLVKKSQEKKIWRGECSNVPKKSKSGVGKKKSCVPCACGASSSHQRSSILWEHFLKMLRTVASPGTFGYHDRCLLIRRLTPTTACGRPP